MIAPSDYVFDPRSGTFVTEIKAEPTSLFGLLYSPVFLVLALGVAFVLFRLSMRPKTNEQVPVPVPVYTNTGLMLSGGAMTADIWHSCQEPSEDPGVHCYLDESGGWMCADNTDLMRECNGVECEEIDMEDSY
jgi:hypothetical protein